MKKIIFLVLITAFVALQFIPILFKKEPAPVSANVSMTNVMSVPDDIKSMLKKSCADCHSQQTDYPWYSYVQPLGMWIDHHIKEGKEHFNMDEFGIYSLEDQQHLLEEMAEEVQEGEMPLKSYTLIHTDAKLTVAEKARFIRWANGNRKPGNPEAGDTGE
jgi:hypothetical protein